MEVRQSVQWPSAPSGDIAGDSLPGPYRVASVGDGHVRSPRVVLS